MYKLVIVTSFSFSLLLLFGLPGVKGRLKLEAEVSFDGEDFTKAMPKIDEVSELLPWRTPPSHPAASAPTASQINCFDCDQVMLVNNTGSGSSSASSK